MIEIIREENSGTTERRSLPKDIRQMGKPDIGERIYVENEVYQFLHPYSTVQEKSAYVLLGRFENYSGRECAFVEAAILLEEIAFDGDLPIWNDDTWAYIYRRLRQEYDSMVIVGWAVDIKGQLPNMTARLEQLHQSNFAGVHQILFLMDGLEREEAFYGNKNGHLCRREGFYIYYEKKAVPHVKKEILEGMGKQEETAAWDWRNRTAQSEENLQGKAAETAGDTQGYAGEDVMEEVIRQRGSYRDQMKETRQSGRKLTPSYASTVLLAAIVCTLGIAAYLNGEKMRSMEETLAQMNQGKMAEMQTENSPEKAPVEVENVAGNVQKQEETAAQSQTAADTTQTPPAADTQAAVDGMPEAAGGGAATPEPAGGNTVAPEPAGENAATPESAGESTAEPEQTVQPPQSTTGEQTTETMTEAQSYLNQGYYIVQKGDSLVGICKRIYQTTALMDKLCEVNGIEDADAIYAGQKLVLPN